MSDVNRGTRAVSVLALACAAAPFIASGWSKQRAFEEAAAIFEAAESFYDGVHAATKDNPTDA